MHDIFTDLKNVYYFAIIFAIIMLIEFIHLFK